MADRPSRCEICGVECDTTKHHLVPFSKSKNKYRENRDDPTNFIWICRFCHDKIHSMFTNNQLRDTYNTKEKLISDEDFSKYVDWRRKHPDVNNSTRMSNERKRR